LPPVVPLRQAREIAALAGRRVLASNVALLVVQGIVPLLGLLAMKQLLDAVDNGIRAADRYEAFRGVGTAVAFAAAVAALGSVLRALGAQVGERHARLAGDRCAELLQAHAARLDLLQIEDPANADLMQRAGAEASQRPARVVQDLAALLLGGVTLASLAAVLATVTPMLPLLVGCAAVPQAMVRLRHARRLYEWQQAHTETQREVVYLGGLLAGRHAAKDVRLFGLAPRLREDIASRRTALREGQLALGARRAWQDALTQIIASVAMFLAYLYLGTQALDGALTIGGLLMHAQAVQRTQNGIRDGLLAWSGLRESRLFLGHVATFLALAPRIRAPAEPVPVPSRPREGLCCEGVRFAYPGSADEVLRGVDLALRPGERVALVGRNGAGKSTIVRLLGRLCDPDAGSVRWGGVDLRALDPDAWRARVSILFQDAAPFEFSVRANLSPGDAEPDDEALLAAAALVGLEDRLRQLPRGLDTRLGRGFAGAVELSAGEWRRLLLARALARPAELLVLDEPFAFLDPPSQQRVAAALHDAPRDRILLVVDQGPRAVDFVDRVLVCEQGRIVADGSPASLAGT
jgi:ATP-binding cassette subfamily B protein